MAQAINYSGVRYIQNEQYSTTNMVGSLMVARDEFNGDCLVCYSDVVYEPRVLREIQQARCSIGVVVDTDFREYWQTRLGDWMDDSESLQIDQSGMIIELGRPKPLQKDVHARYVGLLKFDDEGTNAFKVAYDRHAEVNLTRNVPWYNSRSFRQAYMTDMIQAVVDDGIEVQAIKIARGWLELDTKKDFTLYHQWIENGIMQRFCTLF
jgi:choline kinase